MGRLHHVNLGVHEGDLAAEVEWLTGTLGMTRVEPPTGVGPLWWFADQNGMQVHISVDADHTPARRAHVAIELDDVEAAKHKAVAAGGKVDESEFDGVRVVFCRDPGGNRWELRSPLP
jgi:catechol 2,3-dioxygenase-like lactoylglutathione lyase family enzyme